MYVQKMLSKDDGLGHNSVALPKATNDKNASLFPTLRSINHPTIHHEHPKSLKSVSDVKSQIIQ